MWSSRVKTICELLNTKFGHLSGCLHNCCLFNTLYFFLKIPHQHGTSESNRSLRIPHSGSFRWSSPAAPPLWILSVQRVYPGISRYILVTMFGNLLIILAVISDPHVNILMYSFFSNFSLADISFNTTTVPKMLVNLQTHSKSMP